MKKNMDKKNDKKKFEFTKNQLIIIGVIIVILIVVLIIVISKEKKEKFTLSHIYDVYPEEVRNLYTNMVSVSCGGDLYLDIPSDNAKHNVTDIKHDFLLNYIFSYLDKNDSLNDKMSISDIVYASDKLLASQIDFSKDIKDYQYGNYVYNNDNGVITRRILECSITKKYISYLHGYSFNPDLLSVDVSMGYLNDGKLYDLFDNLLGEYHETETEFYELFKNSSYYRYNFSKDGGKYFLQSVEHIKRGE